MGSEMCIRDRDNLLSWLVSVHSIRSDTNEKVAYEGTKQSYLRPPVIIVGTNSDQPFEAIVTTENYIKNSILNKEYEGHVTAPFFAVNNKTEDDEVVQNLRHKVMKVLKDEPYMGEEVPLRYEGQFYPISLTFSCRNQFILKSRG